MLCDIYRADRKSDTYIYVEKSQGMTRVPEPLLQQLGTLQLVMELEITEETRLARAQASKVLAELLKNGFYLQLPPNVQIFKSP